MGLRVLPGHADGGYLPDNGLSNNFLLRIGEVQNIYFPEDRENVSKRFIEYQVWVQHRANGTAVTKMYDHCLAIDHLGGIADFSFVTYRHDNAATRKDGPSLLTPGRGARVLLLCINGESQNAVIIGAIRNAQNPKDLKVEGHHLHSRFNGVDVQVNNDGEFTLTYGGASQNDGSLVEGLSEDSVGTFVTFSKDGNVTISDKNGDNKIVLDHVNGKAQVFTKTEIDLGSAKVRLGDDQTDDPVPGGNEVKQVLSDLIDAINSITVPTSEGPSGTPINAAQFAEIQGRLQQILSATVFVKM